ncbi:MAG TPA: methyltransferase domain-containing protein [Glycomyces sp.]|nr:methyltransferase domain-containing protein [Glycomyces sp.]
MAEFDKDYWEAHWSPAATSRGRHLPVNPYLPIETAHLPAGTALDAGCGAGAEALWLAEHGWEVTAADIAATALAAARARASDAGADARIEWVEADLTRWAPERTWDLVVTGYAHADIGQLALYRRLASWVAPAGTLLIVGHLHGHRHDDRPGPPQEATATLDTMTDLFSGPGWRIEAGYEHTRAVRPGGRTVQLRDVVVRARRLA